MDRYQVLPDAGIKLSKLDPEETSAAPDKDLAKKRLDALLDELVDLQELLFAQHKHKLLIVLQAMDTGGKDSTIRRVFGPVNPQGVRVSNFKVPTALELEHDFLWRVHHQTPRTGEITIFNRSHYEDVLVVRVHDLVPPGVWSKRYDHINNFERMLAEEGTTILKFFLHISKDEQRQRLQSRLDRPHKRWKFKRGDLKERKLWDKYMQAYEDVLNRTSKPWAPWYRIPANHKWYRDLIIATHVVNALKSLNMEYPQPESDLDSIEIT
jgi:PPK2 family polyphosphate:nucleotide phosphotransferase